MCSLSSLESDLHIQYLWAWDMKNFLYHISSNKHHYFSFLPSWNRICQNYLMRMLSVGLRVFLLLLLFWGVFFVVVFFGFFCLHVLLNLPRHFIRYCLFCDAAKCWFTEPFYCQVLCHSNSMAIQQPTLMSATSAQRPHLLSAFEWSTFGKNSVLHLPHYI